MPHAAIIGLGNAGFRFELDPLRTDIWSHSAAYAASGGVTLVAAVEPDAAKQADFAARYPQVALYRTVPELLAARRIDMVSVCVPTQFHAGVVAQLAGKVAAIFCEKPLAYDLAEAEGMVAVCAGAGTILAVNFMRRWDSVYKRAKAMLDTGMLGEPRTISGYYPGEVFNIGTHMIDTLTYFFGPVAQVAGTVAMREGEREASGSALLRFANGLPGHLVTHGIRKNALFEVDIFGSAGRIRITGNGRDTVLNVYRESAHFSGYNELAPSDLPDAEALGVPQQQRLVAAVEEIAGCIGHPEAVPACSGVDALHDQQVADAVCRSSETGAIITLAPWERRTA
ncbi:MAG: Gfo/Idh/MocA family protein [Desulfovibrionaceae bacterium]